eukprot:s83_g4.t1
MCQTCDRHVEDVQEASPFQKRHSASRKGTGFVAPADLPLSDDEDEQVQSAPAQASSQRHCVTGTGFLSPDDSPHSDEEDDEEGQPRG